MHEDSVSGSLNVFPEPEFALYDENHIISPSCDEWNTPLPMARMAAAFAGDDTETIGTYLEAVQDFLQKNNHAVLTAALREQEGLCTGEAKRILIIQEKHGAFYHPVRIQIVWRSGKHICFGINAAVSQKGRELLSREYKVMERLQGKSAFPSRNASNGKSYLPKMYGCGTGKSPGGKAIPMFMVEWFTGFHEFHYSMDENTGAYRLALWDPETGKRFLPDNWYTTIFSEASRILTLYFNPETLEEIFPWHHAAGDFVIQKTASGPRIRLVTARNYAPRMTREDREDSFTREGSLQDILEGLLGFFFNLSVRMRLDRADGTQEVVWAGEEAVEGAISGVLEGLEYHTGQSEHPGFPLNTGFLLYLSRFSEKEILSRLNILAGEDFFSRDEYPLIETHLPAHAKSIITLAKKYS